MKKRNKIASVVLFLAALVVGFDAQPGWSAWNPSPDWNQCTIGPDALGLVILPDRRVLVAQYSPSVGLYYYPPFPAPPACPTSSTFLKSGLYNSLTVGLDGNIYGFLTTPGHTALVKVNLSGLDTVVLPGNPNVPGLGMTLDPFNGDLYLAELGNTVYQVTHLYHGTPSISAWATITTEEADFDGLAWSCDGRFLFVASPYTDKVFRFDRSTSYVTASMPSGYHGPDGVTVGASGPLAGYVFTNNNDGSVTMFSINPFGSAVTIMDGGQFGDYAYVDAQGAMVARQGSTTPHLQRLFPKGSGAFSGGQFVLPGSSQCSDLACQAKAIPLNIDCVPPISQLNWELITTLSESACGGGCESCTTLLQTRNTLYDLLHSLDPPSYCLDLLKFTLGSLPNPCPVPCVTCNTKLFDGPDLKMLDPILETFLRKKTSP